LILKDNGTEVHANLNKIRGLVGFCPQNTFLLTNNTVYENLAFFAEIKKIPQPRIETEVQKVMTRLGMTNYRDMPVSHLSGGFKRKLNVAIALLKDPKIIIMDEPTSGYFFLSEYLLGRNGSGFSEKFLEDY